MTAFDAFSGPGTMALAQRQLGMAVLGGVECAGAVAKSFQTNTADLPPLPRPLRPDWRSGSHCADGGGGAEGGGGGAEGGGDDGGAGGDGGGGDGGSGYYFFNPPPPGGGRPPRCVGYNMRVRGVCCAVLPAVM